jgi:arylsulfatase A
LIDLNSVAWTEPSIFDFSMRSRFCTLLALVFIVAGALQGSIHADDPLDPAPLKPARDFGQTPVTKAGKTFIYKYSAGKPRRLEVYFPPNHDSKISQPKVTEPKVPEPNVPGIIFFHGGSWKNGTLNQFRRACEYFASRGLVCATAEYQMLGSEDAAKLPAGETRKRVCVTDAKSAIRWFKKHAAEFGMDANRIVAAGGSAGGHIAALATLNPGLNDPGDDTNIDTSVAAYLWFNPAFETDDFKDIEIDVLRFLKPDIAPAIAFFGTEDPWKIGWDVAQRKLKAIGNTSVQTLVARGQSHSFFNKEPWQSATLVQADRFLIQQGLLTGQPTLIAPSEAQMVPDDSKTLNVVFIIADDLGWGELGCYGQTKIPTPNLDRLASQGMRFTQHYSGAPVCAPSRCALMTGKHLGHAEIRGNLQASKHFKKFTEGQYPLSESAVTIFQRFQEAGYATGAMGKWGLGPVGSTGDPNRKGFDLFFGYNCQAVAHSYYPRSLWRNSDTFILNPTPIPGHAKQPTGDVTMQPWIGQTHSSSVIVSEAENFIESNRAKPFFLYLPFIEPHVAMHPPIEAVQRFPLDWDDEVYRGANGYLPHPRPRAAYAAMISELDNHVGRILDAIDKAKLADDTLVIFTSDNGPTHEHPADPRFHAGGADPKFFNSTGGLRGYKGSVYEGGLRVPMIARLPGRIAAGSVSDFPSYFPDWFPTLCDAARLEKSADLDGESLWTVMTQKKKQNRRTPMIWVFPEYGGQIAVRLDQYKVVRRDLRTKKPGAWEVYHLEKDRTEQHDLAARNEPLVKRVENLLQKQVDQNDIFPFPLPTPGSQPDRKD